MDNLEKELSLQQIRGLCERQIPKSDVLKEDYGHYKRPDKSDKDQNYEDLQTCVDRHMQSCLQAKERAGLGRFSYSCLHNKGQW